ncbi:MAG: site-specific integrase [Actinomycetota bacterium]
MQNGSLPRGIEVHYGKFRARKMVRGRNVRRTFGTLDEAIAFLARLERDSADVKQVEAARVSGSATVMEIVKLWWLGPLVDGEHGPEHRGGHRQRVKGQTPRNYQYYIDAYISRIGDESAQTYAQNTALLKVFYDTLPNRVAWHVHSVLRMAFREAVTRGLMDRNPCEFEKPAKRKQIRRVIPTRTDVDKLIVAAEEQDARWGLFVYLTSTLATRAAETVALRTEDFDEARGLVHIHRGVAKTAGRPSLKEPKGDILRDLPIDDAAFWDHVRPFLAETGLLFRGFYRDAPRTPDNVKPWHPDHAEKRFMKMARSLGFKKYTLHTLRHFVATQLLIEGMPINQVAEFLGHSPSMTLMLYGRHLDAEAMRVVGRTAARITPPPPKRDPVRPPTANEGAKPRAQAIDQATADTAILALAEAGTTTNAIVQRETGMTRRQVSKALARLVASGALTRSGTKRGTTYTR